MKRTTNCKMRRVLALLLCLCMMLPNGLTLPVFATETEDSFFAESVWSDGEGEASFDELEAPSEEAEAPPEEAEAPSEEVETPSEEAEAPSEEAEAPSEEVEAPSEEVEAPSEEAEAPSEENETPADDKDGLFPGIKIPDKLLDFFSDLFNGD